MRALFVFPLDICKTCLPFARASIVKFLHFVFYGILLPLRKPDCYRYRAMALSTGNFCKFPLGWQTGASCLDSGGQSQPTWKTLYRVVALSSLLTAFLGFVQVVRRAARRHDFCLGGRCGALYVRVAGKWPVFVISGEVVAQNAGGAILTTIGENCNGKR